MLPSTESKHNSGKHAQVGSDLNFDVTNVSQFHFLSVTNSMELSITREIPSSLDTR
jgi:hypothetical protein